MKKFDAFTVNYWQTILIYLFHLFQIYEKINREIFLAYKKYIYIKENLKNLPSNLLVVTKCSTRDFSCSIDQQISNTVKWDTGPVHAPLRLANRVQLSLS